MKSGGSLVLVVLSVFTWSCVARDGGMPGSVVAGSADPAGRSPREPESAPARPASPRENAWTDPARSALVHECGRCHRSDLPTSVPRALQVFDLTEERWYERMTDRQLHGVVRRSRGIEEPGRTAVLCFVGYALGGTCETIQHEAVVEE